MSTRLADLEPDEIARYSRHLVLPEVGTEGQKRLKAASVVVVGAGGLGAPLGLYLAAAGVGRLGIVDFDAVDPSNLQRQVLYGTADVGRSKAKVALERLGGLNPHIEIEIHEDRLTAGNAREILGTYDIVVDGTDNFPTRFLVNDACVLLGKPNVYGSIFRFEGQASVFWAERGPCYRCLYPEPPDPGAVPNCAEGGVLGVLPGVIGAIQATEAIKLILGTGEPLIGRLVLFDALETRFRELKLRKDPDCPVCGANPSILELTDEPELCEVSSTIDPGPGVVEPGRLDRDITPAQLRARIDRGDDILVVDVRTPMEWQICRIDGATLLPMQDLPSRLEEIDPRREIVVYCHVGGRSAMAVEWLAGRGYERVRNLTGGIDRWSVEVDPSTPRY